MRSIIHKKTDGNNNMFGSRVVKTVFASLLCFCVGVVGTGFLVLSLNKVEEQKGIGGFETAAVPEFTENLTDLLEASGDVISDAEFLEEIEKSETASYTEEELTLQPSVLTYQTYRVKKGDMIGFIADDFDVTQDTIISVNNIKQSRLIQPGQYLKIPSMPGIIYTVKKNGETPSSIAEKYEINADKCALVNNLKVYLLHLRS